MQYNDFLDEIDLKALKSSMNSRAKTVKAKGRLTIAGLRDRILASGGQCEYCTASLVDAPFECDHIIPLQRGGKNTVDNIAIACPTCNRTKSHKHPARFAQETIARTGIKTLLLVRILAHYQVEAPVQRSLFDSSEEASSSLSHDDELRDDPPPYIWKR